MSGKPLMQGPCCPQRGITRLKVGEQGVDVGMVGLETVFQQWFDVNRQSDEIADAEFVNMARISNYIPRRETVEAEYAKALREAYVHFCTRQEWQFNR